MSITAISIIGSDQAITHIADNEALKNSYSLPNKFIDKLTHIDQLTLAINNLFFVNFIFNDNLNNMIITKQFARVLTALYEEYKARYLFTPSELIIYFEDSKDKISRIAFNVSLNHVKIEHSWGITISNIPFINGEVTP